MGRKVMVDALININKQYDLTYPKEYQKKVTSIIHPVQNHMCLNCEQINQCEAEYTLSAS